MSKAIFPSQLVLIVEDDQLLKMLTTDIVEEAGFVALSAENADEAVALLAARSDIAMLLTDINMPGSMDGLELAHMVRDRWPHIKIIVVSAHGEASSAVPAGSLFFHKPYKTEAMISAIDSLIDAGKPGSGARVYLDV